MSMGKTKKKLSEEYARFVPLPQIFSRMFGFDDTIHILEYFKDKGIQICEYTEGISSYLTALKQRKATIPAPFNILNPDLLNVMDANIRMHLDSINEKRTEPINLRPFQYVSLLFAEIFLKHRSEDRLLLLEILNQCIKALVKKFGYQEYKYEDLDKLCFWMATGSGKTIIMHINYLQYLHYARESDEKVNNVLLLTPNEDLCEQHLKMLEDSDLKGVMVRGREGLTKYLRGDKIEIKTLPFGRLVDKAGRNKVQKSKGVTVDYRAFGDNNLILVDEGHRGSSGNTWMEMREKVSKKGFTFEYSATFHGVLESNDGELAGDYRKSIIIDYSYKYFYKDGYGKDYDISNLPEEKNENDQIYIMLGNLLSFYEQKKYYQKYTNILTRDYNIEDPLWLLVGSSVDPSVKKVNKATLSDIKQFVLFLHGLQEERNLTKNRIRKILDLETDIVYKDTNRNFFEDRFDYLKYIFKKDLKEDHRKLLKDIFKVVFYCETMGSLVLSNMKSQGGEIGLKYEGGEYFGLIYIGKGSEPKLINNIIETQQNVIRRDAELGRSLFDTLNKKHIKNPLNLLIGAKKFIEGWDNYRISSMLLLNFAKGKGASAIQLFGRGVRLKGYGNGMKRTTHVPEVDPPDNINVIEKLNVFGIHAKYMEEFRRELEEGEITYFIEKQLNVDCDPYGILKDNKLIYIRQNIRDIEGKFKRENIYTLNKLRDTRINVDTTSAISALKSKKSSYDQEAKEVIKKSVFLDKFTSFVNWNNILSRVLRYKKVGGYNNIYLSSKEHVRDLLGKLDIKLLGSGAKFDIENYTTYEEIISFKRFLEELYSNIINKFIKRFYTAKLRKESETSFRVDELKAEDILPAYNIKIEVDKKEIPKLKGPLKNIMEQVLNPEEPTQEVKNAIDVKSMEELIKKNQTSNSPFLIEFDRHVYYPLLVSSKKGYALSPPGLNEGEKEFVENLKGYIDKNKKALEGTTIVLLRNHERRGLGFYLETEKFYYDFILWFIKDGHQYIYFIDPKGLVHIDNQKMNFNREGIERIERELKKREIQKNFTLDSFFISQTHKDDIRDGAVSDDPHDDKVYFPEEYDQFFSRILK